MNKGEACHRWCKCRNSYVQGGCNVKTHWAFVAPGLRAGQADYDNCIGPDYSLYQAPRNPMDFTPKAVYEEMDRQAKQHRTDRLMLRIVTSIIWGVVGALVGVLIARLSKG